MTTTPAVSQADDLGSLIRALASSKGLSITDLIHAALGEIKAGPDVPAPPAASPREGGAWHDAVLAECMAAEACYLPNDPAKTLSDLISWHVQREREYFAGGAFAESGNAGDGYTWVSFGPGAKKRVRSSMVASAALIDNGRHVPQSVWAYSHSDFKHFSGAMVWGQQFLRSSPLTDFGYYQGCDDLVEIQLFACKTPPGPLSQSGKIAKAAAGGDPEVMLGAARADTPENSSQVGEPMGNL